MAASSCSRPLKLWFLRSGTRQSAGGLGFRLARIACVTAQHVENLASSFVGGQLPAQDRLRARDEQLDSAAQFYRFEIDHHDRLTGIHRIGNLVEAVCRRDGAARGEEQQGGTVIDLLGERTCPIAAGTDTRVAPRGKALRIEPGGVGQHGLSVVVRVADEQPGLGVLIRHTPPNVLVVTWEYPSRARGGHLSAYWLHYTVREAARLG